jgi:histidine triad (HIT) family protein
VSANCIFCKIASGQIPSLRVFESEDALAFLDIAPLAPGHTLLIPKTHCSSLLEVSPEMLSRLTAHLPALGSAILNSTGATGLNVLQNSGESSGQAVFHLHFHLIPRVSDDGLGFRWNAGAYAAGEAESMQKHIKSSLAGH